MTDKQTPPDWVLIEAAKRSGTKIKELHRLRSIYTESLNTFTALCDMIAKHEQPPVDRKLLCAREAMRNKGQNKVWSKEEVAVRAITLWEEGFGND